MDTILPITSSVAIYGGTNVVDDGPEWNVSASYVIDDIVVTEITKEFTYKALTNNTGKKPIDNPTDWELQGYNNPFRIFDQQTASATSNDDSIDIVLTPAQIITGIALFRVVADTVRIKMTTPGPVVIYDETFDMLDLAGIDDFWPWFFEPPAFKTEIAILNLPPYVEASVQIIATKTGSVAEIGEAVLGTTKNIGIAGFEGTTVGIEDYSTKEVDADTGIVTLTPGGYAKIADYMILIPTDRVSSIQGILANYRAAPMAFIGNSDLGATIIYGFYRDLSMVLDNAKTSTCNLQVLELS
jgi:hypothetical protein